ncbi:MAG: hypothetical protein M3A24_02725 [Candidatus Rhabdochlamydia oedothoracis]|nr:hypothetical protein [Candidatus Rhabdochlamydia oedothoracis]
MGISQLKKAFSFKGLRVIFLCSFLNIFAWSYFFGAAGGYCALSAGLLIRPFINRFKPEILFILGMFLSALVILSMPFLKSAGWLFFVMFFVCFFTSNAAALILSPLFSGSINSYRNDCFS